MRREHFLMVLEATGWSVQQTVFTFGAVNRFFECVCFDNVCWVKWVELHRFDVRHGFPPAVLHVTDFLAKFAQFEREVTQQSVNVQVRWSHVDVTIDDKVTVVEWDDQLAVQLALDARNDRAALHALVDYLGERW